MQRRTRPLSNPALKYLKIFNIASAVLQLRNHDSVIAKAIHITKDKKILNQKRKELARTEAILESITDLTHHILSQVSYLDLQKIMMSDVMHKVRSIPEKTTNPHILGLYMLYITFKELHDLKMDVLFLPLKEFDYIKLIDVLSEEIGLEKNVADDMWTLALTLVEDIKK